MSLAASAAAAAIGAEVPDSAAVAGLVAVVVYAGCQDSHVHWQTVAKALLPGALAEDANQAATVKENLSKEKNAAAVLTHVQDFAPSEEASPPLAPPAITVGKAAAGRLAAP